MLLNKMDMRYCKGKMESFLSMRTGAFFSSLLVFLLTGNYLFASEVRVDLQSPNPLRVTFETDETEFFMVPSSGWLVGLPFEGEVRLTIIEAQSELIETADLIEESVVPFQELVYLGEPGFVRDQRVVELIFAPWQKENEHFRLFTRVVIDLHFSDVRVSEGKKREGRWGEAFLSQVLLNYEQARHWQRPWFRRATKPVLQGDGIILLKVVVQEKGLYRITGADLEKTGVALQDIGPNRLRMFYGGGRSLPLELDSLPVERKEISVVVEDGGDGYFEADDFILFYGEPVSRWEYHTDKDQFQYQHNLYTHDNVYWLGIGGDTPRRELTVRRGALQEKEPQRPGSYRVRVHGESEQFILTQTYNIKSGYDWYWEDFHGNARNFPNLIRDAVDEPVDIRLRFWKLFNKRAGRAWHPQFTVKWNDEEVGEIDFQSVESRTLELQTSKGSKEGLNQLGLFHTNAELARLDWYELEYSRGFSAEHGELFFTSPVTEGVAEFRLTGFAEERPRVFEVSEELVEIIDFVHEGETGSVVFQDESGAKPRQYAVAEPSRWKRPVRLELGRPGRLLETFEGADYLIITHRDFRAEAEKLAAWRGQDKRFEESLRTMVVDVQEIYDEFSGGLLDPTAIRNFMAHIAKNWEPAPFFVLLLGDGTYDYKNNSGMSIGNWIPAYQDGDSTYDEWYVRVFGDDVLPDMAIGRIPVQTVAEARAVVDKLIAYDQQREVGPWQSRILLVADDLNNPEYPDRVESDFLRDAEYMAQNLLPPNLNLRKLYIAQFPLRGSSKPQAKEAFIRRFNEGSLILTYLGHGNPDVLAHEQMFVVSRDLGEIDNKGRLPLFYTAASQVGVFDDPVRSSMPEALLKLPNGGVIGMISATRVGYHLSNMTLANAFHQQMYRSGREHVPVGQALMEAKQFIQVGSGPMGRRNIQRYSLFGDPAMHLAMPRYRVEIQVPDSLRALEEIRIDGQVLDTSGRPVSNFDGQAWIQAFDSSVVSQLDGLTYQQVGVALFRGFYPVEDGRFSALFRVPKDITYRGTNGRVSAYVWSDNHPSAFGSASRLVLAGTAEGVELDQVGPEIAIGFEGQESFTSGGQIPPNAVLRAVIRDHSGINVTGETGHEIELIVDREVFKVTEFFSVHGNYREGILEYPLPALELGEHEIRLEAWDSFNNSAQAEIEVIVSEKTELLLSELLFYPNPLRKEDGYFTFNLALPARSVRIQVFSLSGRLVDEVDGEASQGFNQVAWRPNQDLANGAYLYRVQVEREDGRKIARTAVIQVIK